MVEKVVRIRLKFQDARILTKQQIDQGLAQCWHLVHFDEVRTIADVESDISSTFYLGESCPFGLGLEVDGFALPPSQPAHLLKDSDLVRIRRRNDLNLRRAAEGPVGVRNNSIVNVYRCASHGGLELCAMDEVEKETGVYKSEKEEGEMETDLSLDGGGRALGCSKVTPYFVKELERSSKKRKQAKDPETDSGKKNKNFSNGLDLSLANLGAKQEKFKVKEVSECGRINLRALDEFEGELGGYESEQEDDENEEETDFSLGGTKTVPPFEVRPSGTPKQGKRGAKKQIGSKKEDLDLVQEEPKLAPKKKKKRKSLADIIVGPTEESLELGPVKKKEKKSLKRAAEAEAQNKDGNRDVQPQSFREKLSKGNAQSDLLSAQKVGDDCWMDLEDTLMDSDKSAARNRKEGEAAKVGAPLVSTPIKDSKNEPAEGVHTPSRSARRKKAKRKWLREQEAKAGMISAEDDVPNRPLSNAHIPPTSTEEAVEVETVEELQSVVVRAGHIRFEPFDEENSGDQPVSSLPTINLGEQFKTKRQGQNWGQEKSEVKQKGQRWSKEAGYEGCPEINGHKNKKSKHEYRVHNIDFEKLPSLQSAPQGGDVIAYRLVELTPSWTPELSPFRVGVVVDKTTDAVRLAPHPDYPFCPTRDSELDYGTSQEIQTYPLPYSEDGFLETELSALVDLRLVEKNPEPPRGPEAEISKQNAENQGRANPEDGSLSLPTVSAKGEPRGSSGPNNRQIQIETQLVVTEGSTQSPPQEMVSTKASDDNAETQKDEAPSTDWQTLLTKELQRKKLEIRQKHANTGGNQTSEGPEKTSAKSRKSKYLRSAGVGSIVALLRAQQAL